MEATTSSSRPEAGTPRCTRCRPRGSSPETAMRELLRALRLMLGISFAADPVRSVAALITASGQMVSMPLRAAGMAILVDGMASHDHHRAALGAVLIAGLSALGRLMT